MASIIKDMIKWENKMKETEKRETLQMIGTISIVLVVSGLICGGVVKQYNDIKKDSAQKKDVFQPIEEFKFSWQMRQTPTTGYRVVRLNEKQYDLLQKALNAERQKQR